MAVVNGRAFRNAAFSIPGPGWNKIPLDDTSPPGFDPNLIWDVTTNHRATPNVSGLYQVNASYQCTLQNSPETAGIGLYLNGSIYAQGTTVTDHNVTAGDVFAATVSDEIRFNGTTDYVELWAYNSGSNAQPLAPLGGPYTYLSLVWVAP